MGNFSTTISPVKFDEAHIMKRFSIFAVFTLLLILLNSGCTTTEVEVDIPVDITLEELQAKMSQALDPSGRYSAAKTYVMRQTAYTDRFLDDPAEQLVELKFARPDSLNLITYEDNEPSVGMIVNGKNGWVADYKRRKVVKLDEQLLQQLKLLSTIASPDCCYTKIFASVTLSGCRIEDKQYYKITCQHHNPQQGPTVIYVDFVDYLPRRWKTVFEAGGSRIKYDSRIAKYALREGVMIPEDTTVYQNGDKQRSVVKSYRLDVDIPSSTFLPPIF